MSYSSQTCTHSCNPDAMSVKAEVCPWGCSCFVQAKRRKAEELKELARSIRDKNARLVSGLYPVPSVTGLYK